MQLAVGARVRLHGLQAKPELNGREGTVKEQKADSGRWTVDLGDGTGFAFKGSNLEVTHPGYGFGTKPAPAPSADVGVLEGFDRLLGGLETTRRSVFDMTKYCMDNAAEHAAPLAQRLAKSLGKPGLGGEAYTARLFAVSDVIHNSRGKREGASQFGASIQEHLPEACEKMGRIWLRRIEAQEARDGAEDAVRQVLSAWQDWSVFPPLFVKGLESLLFAQVYEITAKEAGAEPDEKLRQKLTKWFAGLNQAQLPHACHQRGIAGKALSTTACRARLCHFERYWHLRPGSVVRLSGLLSAPHLNGTTGTCERWDMGAARWKVRLHDGTVKAVKQDNLLLDDRPVSRPGSEQAGGAGASKDPALQSALVPASGAGGDSLDGEPLSEEELAEVLAMEVDEVSVESTRPLQRGYGVWTQVSDPGAGCLVSPADHHQRGSNGAGRR